MRTPSTLQLKYKATFKRVKQGEQQGERSLKSAFVQLILPRAATLRGYGAGFSPELYVTIYMRYSDYMAIGVQAGDSVTIFRDVTEEYVDLSVINLDALRNFVHLNARRASLQTEHTPPDESFGDNFSPTYD